MADTLGREELKLMDAHWRAANYLSVGQIYTFVPEGCPIRIEHE
jgi:phosphoketolase